MASQKPTTSRRSVLGAAILLPAAALFASAAAGAGEMPSAWREVMRDWGRCHPDGARVALRAYQAGCSLSDLESVSFVRAKGQLPGHAVAMFTTPTGYLVVQPRGIAEYRRAPGHGCEPAVLGREAVKDAWIAAHT